MLGSCVWTDVLQRYCLVCRESAADVARDYGVKRRWRRLVRSQETSRESCARRSCAMAAVIMEAVRKPRGDCAQRLRRLCGSRAEVARMLCATVGPRGPLRTRIQTQKWGEDEAAVVADTVLRSPGDGAEFLRRLLRGSCGDVARADVWRRRRVGIDMQIISRWRI